MNPSNVAAAAITLLLLHPPTSDAAISCTNVVSDLMPCVTYLVTGSGTPPPACCKGVTTLAAAATSTADRQAACKCIKGASKSVSINTQLAQALPANCKVATSLVFSPNMDCSKIT